MTGSEEAAAGNAEYLRQIAHVPFVLRREVRRAHVNLGHCSRDALLRMMRHAKAVPDAMYYARLYTCPICMARAAPASVLPASGRDRPTDLNGVVALDLKEVTDANGDRYVALNILDVATSFSMLSLLPDKKSSTVAKEFTRCWTAWGRTTRTACL